MRQFSMDRRIVFILRVMMGWTFLYAGLWQVASGFNVAPFLLNTKTFHALYAPLGAPEIAPYLSLAVSWGQLLIGLSLVSGLLVPLSGTVASLVLTVYWTAHMDFPYIENRFSYLVDFHIVYAVLTGWLAAVGAGHAYGLDGLLSRRSRTV